MIAAITYSYVVIGILAVVITVGLVYWWKVMRPIKKEQKSEQKKKDFYNKNDIRIF